MPCVIAIGQWRLHCLPVKQGFRPIHHDVLEARIVAQLLAKFGGHEMHIFGCGKHQIAHILHTKIMTRFCACDKARWVGHGHNLMYEVQLHSGADKQDSKM